MPARKRSESVALTVRTEPQHAAVVKLLAQRYRVTQSDMGAILLADHLGLSRPEGTPEIGLRPSETPTVAAKIAAEVSTEVMPESA